MLLNNKKLLLIITLLAAALIACSCSDTVDSDYAAEETVMEQSTDTAEETEIEQTYDMPIELKDGYDKLQSLFLQIDDTFTVEDIEEIAEGAGFYVEETQPYHILVFISDEESTGYTLGGEPIPTYDVDYVEVSCFKDEDKGGDYYAFSKTYCVKSTDLDVDYTFYNKELTVTPHGTVFADSDIFDSVEDALNTALDK